MRPDGASLTGERRLPIAVWLALCFHGPLVAAGLYDYSYDVGTHLFLASHYQRSWFALWDPRWFAGFSTNSYPPLVHQLLALLAFPLGLDRAFGSLLLLTLLAFPIAVWYFASLFVSRSAAGAAAIVAVFLPAAALSGDMFGQLPTLVSLTLALFLAYEWTRYVERGGVLRLALIAALSGATFAAHHATPLLFLPPALLACLWAVSRAGQRAVQLRRAFGAGLVAAVTGGLAILPFWIWAATAERQAFIPHLSRADYLTDLAAQGLFFWAMYGVLPAMALFGVRAAGRCAVGLVAVAGFFGILGLGGTTAVPALLFGEEWRWLTYDRFALWCAVTLLPFAGLAVDRLLTSPTRLARAAVGLAVGVLALYASIDATSSLLGPTLPYERDLLPIADFMNAGDRSNWRYQTFGFGDNAARLGSLTIATTIDGAYFSARRLPALSSSGIGMVDYALWWDPSGDVLRRVLARSDDYAIRWAFVVDPSYDSYLQEAGFSPTGSLHGDIEVWEKLSVPLLPATARSFGEPDTLGVLWGTLPLIFAALATGFALALNNVRLGALVRRNVDRWTRSRLLHGPVSSHTGT